MVALGWGFILGGQFKDLGYFSLHVVANYQQTRSVRIIKISKYKYEDQNRNSSFQCLHTIYIVHQELSSCIDDFDE